MKATRPKPRRLEVTEAGFKPRCAVFSGGQAVLGNRSRRVGWEAAAGRWQTWREVVVVVGAEQAERETQPRARGQIQATCSCFCPLQCGLLPQPAREPQASFHVGPQSPAGHPAPVGLLRGYSRRWRAAEDSGVDTSRTHRGERAPAGTRLHDPDVAGARSRGSISSFGSW